MMYRLINPDSGRDTVYNNDKIADFLVEHLDQYGDNKEDILRALDYVFEEHKGGHILLLLETQEIIGAVVVNKTGMFSYIPENILVYIAIHHNYRGKGLGKKLMQEVISVTKGSIALHVEPDNPAVNLYKKLGFSNKYLEMRLEKTEQD